jgi:uncharacterized membrane protein YphA (DoxX/SURF4 family)
VALGQRERGWVQTPVVFTLPLRLVPGYLFLTAAINKIQAGWLGGTGLQTTLEEWLSRGGTYTWYESFLRDTVIPHQDLFAHLVVIGEMAVGSLLLIGFLVRPASFVGILMCLNYLFAKGGALIGFSSESLFLILLATAMLVNPGRALGVDGFLYERLRLPRWLI